jgi:putative hemolysin
MNNELDSSAHYIKHIDVEKVIASKNKNLLKWIPRFVTNYLKRVIHQDFLNDFIHRNRDFYGLDFVNRIIVEFGAELSWEGLENLKKNERYIIASNHPLGGLDGIALMHVVGKFRKDILFPVNDLLMNLPNLKDLFIPINKHGSNFENARIIDKSFESDVLMLYFPAGLVSRKQKGKIKDLEWKKTFIRKARSYKRHIVPVHINGRNSNWFYNFANFRKFVGIKPNIEMLYLVDEMLKQKGQKIHIKFGNPIDFSTLDKSKKDAEWAEEIKKKAYLLAK